MLVGQHNESGWWAEWKSDWMKKWAEWKSGLGEKVGFHYMQVKRDQNARASDEAKWTYVCTIWSLNVAKINVHLFWQHLNTKEVNNAAGIFNQL